MTSIGDLISRLCPNGVQLVSVTDVADYVRGVTYSKSDEQENGGLSVLRANNVTLSSNTLNLNDVKRVSSSVRVRDNQRLIKGDILMCAGSGSTDHIGKVAFIHEDRAETFGGFMAVVRTRDQMEPRFLFHILTGSAFLSYLRGALSTTTINNLNAGIMRGFRIPVPPLEVQREIVRILDQFTQLEAELEAELEARRVQYAYYLSALFAFDDTRIARRPFAELGSFARGGGPQKKDFQSDGIGCIHYGQIYTHYGSSAHKTNVFVSPAVAAKSRMASPGDVVIAVTSENDADLARSVAWVGSDPVAVSNHTLIFSADMNPKFVSYFLRTHLFDRAKRRYITGTKVKSLPLRAFEEIEIPVPPRSEQDRIVELLDQFDALVNDLSIGLPAEIAARRKQYEYYRDRLLTFEEAAA